MKTVGEILTEVLKAVSADDALGGLEKAQVLDAMTTIVRSNFSEAGIQRALGEFAQKTRVRKYVCEFLFKTGHASAVRP